MHPGNFVQPPLAACRADAQDLSPPVGAQCGEVGPSSNAKLDAQAEGNWFTHRTTAGGYDVGQAATLRELREEASELKIR